MKKLIAIIVILVILFPGIVSAEERLTQLDTDTVIVDADSAVVNAETVIIKDGVRVIKGTVIRSVNHNNSNIPFKPGDYVARTVADILKTDTYNFGTVATSEFNLNGEATRTSYDGTQTIGSVKLTKEEYLLGGDITIRDDDYNFDTGVYTYTSVDSDGKLSLDEAVMMIYKAVGLSQYKYDFKFSRRGLTYLPIGETPLMELVPDTFAAIDNSRYYTDVFTTRSNIDAYWDAAKVDRIMYVEPSISESISIKQFAEHVRLSAAQKCDTLADVKRVLENHSMSLPQTVTELNFSTNKMTLSGWYKACGDSTVTDTKLLRSSQITMADFCYYLKLKLEREGEPVLTDEEMEMMLLAHGRDVPLYLREYQRDAVKYLIARGIADADMDYSGNITADTATVLLCRAANNDLRLTLKNVDYPYIETLVKKGYAPTEISENTAPLMDITATLQDANIVSDLDYYIERTESSIFKSSGSDNIVNEVYVSGLWGDISNEPFRGSEVDTIDNGRYYHLRIPIAIKEDVYDETKKVGAYNETKGTFVINTPNVADSPEYIEVPYGGGVYSWDYETDELVRSPFTSDFSSELMDLERKTNAIYNSLDSAKLAAIQRKVVFKFKLTDPQALTTLVWDGKPLTEAGLDIFSGNADSEGNYSITVEADDPYKYLMRHLTYKAEATSNSLVRAYVADDRNILVSTTWLRKRGLLSSVTEVVPDSKWVISSNTESTLVDLENGYIVTGQTVIEINKNDTSPLVVKDSISGEFFLDYRTVNNMSSDYLLVSDSNGVLSITSAFGEAVYSNVSYNSSVFPLLGDDTQFIKNMRGNSSLLSLEGAFPLGNWLVYKKRSGTENADYLLVFRPGTAERSTIQNADTKENKLLSDFGLRESSHVKIHVYRIDTTIIVDDDSARKAKNFIITKPMEETCGVYYDISTSRYYYKIPTYHTLESAYKDYMQESPVIPLPFVRYSYTDDSSGYPRNALVNLNINLYNKAKTSLEHYPESLRNNAIPTTELRGVDFDPQKFILALAGVQSVYYPFDRKSGAEINTAVDKIYFGSMLTNREASLGEEFSIIYRYLTNGKVVMESSSDMSSKAFSEVFRGPSSSIYVYGLDDKFRLVSSDGSAGKGFIAWSKRILESGSKSLFDWEAFSLSELLQGADNGITLANIFVLRILPRILLFIFVAFLALTLVVDNKLLRWVAAKVVDPFKVLSFGLTDIEHVRTKNAWLSIFIAMSMMAMMSTGILELVSWLVEFFMYLIQLK